MNKINPDPSKSEPSQPEPKKAPAQPATLPKPDEPKQAVKSLDIPEKDPLRKSR